MRRLAAIIALMLCCAGAWAQSLPSCARADSSSLRIPGDSLRFVRFAERLKAARDCPDSSVTVWHIGGSHVQAGWFSSRIRHNFDSLGLYPAGGRGFLFPYPLAHTNFDRSYYVRGEGEWLGSRSSNPNKAVPVSPRWGVTGLSAYTADTLAAFVFGMQEPFCALHILAQASDTLVRPVAIVGTDTLKCVADSLLHGYYLEFGEPVDSVRIEMRLQDGQHFTVTGLYPESPFNGGVRFVATGVNGARTTTFTDRCPEFGRELQLIHPDLVLLGLGINDSTCPAKDFKPEKFKANYRRLLDKILAVSPDCALVFITNNDSWRYVRRHMVHNDNGAAVREAMFELAQEYDGAVWDLFTLMGGNGSASLWRDEGLMKNDRLHFTREGYELLGDLLYRAIMDECGK